jgi:hypothetical protein
LQQKKFQKIPTFRTEIFLKASNVRHLSLTGRKNVNNVADAFHKDVVLVALTDFQGHEDLKDLPERQVLQDLPEQQVSLARPVLQALRELQVLLVLKAIQAHPELLEPQVQLV